MVVCLERWGQVCHFEDYDSQRPNVALLVVALLVALLRAHIERAADIGFRELALAAYSFC